MYTSKNKTADVNQRSNRSKCSIHVNIENNVNIDRNVLSFLSKNEVNSPNTVKSY